MGVQASPSASPASEPPIPSDDALDPFQDFKIDDTEPVVRIRKRTKCPQCDISCITYCPRCRILVGTDEERELMPKVQLPLMLDVFR